MIELKNVSKTYNKSKKNEVRALKNASLIVNKGEMLAVTGVSGSGKSTILHIIGCVLKFDSGEYFIDGEDVSRLSESELAKIRNKKIGMVFQNFMLLPDNTALENVEIPLLLANIPKKTRKKRCIEALEKVKMDEAAERSVKELSGGQKQRVAIARAIVNNAEYIIADEPTGALDSKNTEMIYRVLYDISRSGKAVIIVTHDTELAAKCDRQICLLDGKASEL